MIESPLRTRDQSDTEVGPTCRLSGPLEVVVEPGLGWVYLTKRRTLSTLIPSHLGRKISTTPLTPHVSVGPLGVGTTSVSRGRTLGVGVGSFSVSTDFFGTESLVFPTSPRIKYVLGLYFLGYSV